MSTVEPYRVFLGAASANSGPSASAVLVVRGAQSASKHTTIKYASYDEALWAAFAMALTLLAEKRNAPIEIVVPSPRLLAAAEEPSASDAPMLARGKEAFATVNRPRSKDARVTLRLSARENTQTQQVHRIAYDAAFPRAPSVVAPGNVHTTPGGAPKTP